MANYLADRLQQRTGDTQQPQPLKARIERADGKGEPVYCHFNPTDFTIVRENSWKTPQARGKNTPKEEFAGGKTSDLTIKLLFDTTHTENEDVRDTYRALVEMAGVDPDNQNPTTAKGEPPRCKFIWGHFLSFTSFIKKINQKFTMFRLDGTPVRAEIEVTFGQVSEVQKPQNPTSRSDPRKIWLVQEGQTLDWIAYQEYGDPAQWRHIAEMNDLLDARDLQPGQVLKLVPLP